MVWQYNIGEHGLESPSAANQVYAFRRPRAPAMRVDKVLLADAVVDADNAALEGGEVALNLIGVCVAAQYSSALWLIVSWRPNSLPT
jgi:hypothetical protein